MMTSPPPWPDTGPAVVTGSAGELIYRMPTLVTCGPAWQGAVASDRSPQQVTFAYTEDGTLVHYQAVLDQDALFRLLTDAGLLERDVIG